MAKKKSNVKITKLTNEKYLNLFRIEYVESGVKWLVASRRSEGQLDIVSRTKTADAVNILPYSVGKKGDITIYLIKEFRHSIGDFVLSLPAGLVENGRTEEETVKSEIYEEIGGEVLSCRCVDRNAYTSVGLTDEKLSFFEAEVELSGRQHLEKTEVIEIVPVPLSKVEKTLDDKKVEIDLKGRYALRHFVESQKILRLEKEKTELIAKLKEKTNCKRVKKF